MKKFALAATAAITLTAAPLHAGNVQAPVMEPAVIEAETASSSANQAEMVAVTLTALIFVTALVTAY
ncbi:hypothetical protein DC366_01145 [Pelagivirga sediminicola]|uniref:Ferrochelatase n=1 Tax=Pelagivirga sediminicola TaxID=2170575 RepID=A0A2T7GB01_9RHOB|nr:hypothetical protein [Pelagivirga sediminicola]PVA11604.1 hypothetical protein DC366_01145 [Pelagivirga sediminicola]